MSYVQSTELWPFLSKAAFCLSAAYPETLPMLVQAEVAFSGVSNVGKSSVLNCVVGQKNLAKVSKTPGRTELINAFSLPEERYLIDLPGLGYAKLPLKQKKLLETRTRAYLMTRVVCQGVVWVMDCRHPLRTTERALWELLQRSQKPIHVLLNKADQLSRSESLRILMRTQEMFREAGASYSTQLFSTRTAQGLSELIDTLKNWLGPVL